MSASPVRLRRRAFTLVELLVVIAVLGVLASILVPVVAKVRSSARSTHCVSNLQQLGRAFILHAQDHRGLLPAPVDTTGGEVRPWFVALHPYMGMPWKSDVAVGVQLATVFTCPTWLGNGHAPAPGDIGYAMSSALGPTVAPTRPVPLSSLQQPTRSILLLEQTATETPFFPVAGTLVTFGETYAASTGVEGCDRHDGAANYLFADGHVGHHTPFEAAQMLK